MTALSPIPPDVFKTLLEKYGFVLQETTEYNWTFFKEDAAYPLIVLPRKGSLVAVDVMMGILNKLKMDNATYFNLLSQIQH